MKAWYTPRALADREEIFSYLDQRNPQAAQNVIAVITRQIESLPDQPYKGRPTDRSGI